MIQRRMSHNNGFIFVLLTLLIGTASYFLAREHRLLDTRPPAPPPADAPARQEVEEQRLQKFSLTGYDEQGRKFWNIEGETAKIDAHKVVFLDQNVTLRMQDGTLIRTDKVEWSQEKGKMRTDQPVVVTRENVHLTGVGAVGEVSRNFIQLNRDIVMHMQPDGKLTCDGPMKAYYGQNKMVFYRNVRAEDGRGILTANRMDVLFEQDNKRIQQIVAIGDVMITRGTDTTHSRRAIYTPATGSLRLEGNPEITLHKGSKALIDASFGNTGA
ncbi:MAG: Lipopolysaccharide export system protein LptC [Candidatus Omnitrophica bacterium]|nr:Lipopolysaccharide export system protein LptC [Candidatus Omnitrophota bacterium]